MGTWQLIRVECQNRSEPYCILEIGSWAGGSAVTWADALRRFNSGNGLVVCVDPWQSYLKEEGTSGHVSRIMEKALLTGEIVELFLHNIRSSGHEDVVRMIRASSDEFLPLRRPEAFDLIFIDGRAYPPAGT